MDRELPVAWLFPLALVVALMGIIAFGVWRVGVTILVADLAVVVVFVAWASTNRRVARGSALLMALLGLSGAILLTTTNVHAMVAPEVYAGVLLIVIAGTTWFAVVGVTRPRVRMLWPLLLASFLVFAAGVILFFVVPTQLVGVSMICLGVAGLIATGGLSRQVAAFDTYPHLARHRPRHGGTVFVALLLVVAVSVPLAFLALAGAAARADPMYIVQRGTPVAADLDGAGCGDRIFPYRLPEYGWCWDATWSVGGQTRTGTVRTHVMDTVGPTGQHSDSVRAFGYGNQAVTPAFIASVDNPTNGPVLRLGGLPLLLWAAVPLALAALATLIVLTRRSNLN